jgi:two-component system NtrC family sensor kinase
LSTSVRPTPPAGLAPIPAALASLGDIAARLASSETVSEVMPGVLEAVRLALHARECTLWLDTVNGLVRSYGVGEDTTRPEEVAGMLSLATAWREGLAIAPLVAGQRPLGAISARVDRPLADEERVLFAAVGNMIAPPLSYAEHSHLLEVEVEARARQIGEQWLFMEKVIDSLPVGLYVIDREYRIQTWNRKRETGLQGVSREEAIGRTIFEILHRQPAELLRREFDEVFATGRIQQFQMESTLTGDLRVYRITKIPMRLDDVNVTHVITIGEDVSDWKEAEARFAQTEKLAAIGQLAAGVMHEINNPLATIAACAESLGFRLADAEADGRLLGDANEYLKIVDNEVHRCKRIIDQLLEFSRPRPVVKESVVVNDVIQKTLFLLKHHARFKKITVHTMLDPELGGDVHGNPDQLVQVFMALLLNALDAMGDRGTITIRTRRGRNAAEAVIVEVIDEGVGIPRSEQSKIFEPFFTTKAPGRGTGLGLSICYGIVAEHGGRIEVDSVPGKGSTFRIILPAGGNA